MSPIFICCCSSCINKQFSSAQTLKKHIKNDRELLNQSNLPPNLRMHIEQCIFMTQKLLGNPLPSKETQHGSTSAVAEAGDSPPVQEALLDPELEMSTAIMAHSKSMIQTVIKLDPVLASGVRASQSSEEATLVDMVIDHDMYMESDIGQEEEQALYESELEPMQIDLNHNHCM
jgi:hypothetical protein